MITHTNRLTLSEPSYVYLFDRLEADYMDLVQLARRARAVELIPPSDLVGDLLLWRTALSRHRNGDYRHTESEWTAIKNICQWFSDTKSDLCDQKKQQLEWQG